MIDPNIGYKLESQNPKEFIEFCNWARSKNFDTYMEIGSYAGDSLREFIEHGFNWKELGSTIPNVIVVDKPTNAKAFEKLKEYLETIKERVNLLTIWEPSQNYNVFSKVYEFLKIYSKYSFVPGNGWKKNNARRLLFIDGSHDFYDVQNDYLTFKDFFGYVAFNDIDHRISASNVKKHGYDKLSAHHFWQGLKSGLVPADYESENVPAYLEIIETSPAVPRGIGIINPYKIETYDS